MSLAILLSSIIDRLNYSAENSSFIPTDIQSHNTVHYFIFYGFFKISVLGINFVYKIL